METVRMLIFLFVEYTYILTRTSSKLLLISCARLFNPDIVIGLRSLEICRTDVGVGTILYSVNKTCVTEIIKR